MIEGAAAIIRGVPGRHLDPFLLAKSQSPACTGFVLVSYDASGGAIPSESDCSPALYDVLCFQGPVVQESLRFNRDLKCVLEPGAAVSTFRRNRERPGTAVSLYLASEELLRLLRATFTYEPCIKVDLEVLTKKHILRLFASSRCRRGIIECIAFSADGPEIRLVEARTPEELLAFAPQGKRGRLLLYDVERNLEIAGRTVETRAVAPDGEEASHPAGAGGPRRRAGGVMDLFEDTDAFGEYIRNILRDPAPPRGEVQERSSGPEGGTALLEGRVRPAGDGSGGQAAASGLFGRDSAAAREAGTGGYDRARDAAELVRVFDRLFRSFRRQAYECFGDALESVMARAEAKVRIVSPEFSRREIGPDALLATLDLIEAVIAEASLFRRAKLRQAAAALISDLYNRQYDLLERHGAVDRVEETYYRLRR